MNKKIVLFWSLSVFLAFSLGRLYSPSETTSQEIETEKIVKATDSKTDILTQKLEKLTSSELNEYKQLKTQEEKYNKAKEIYEKVFQMLLATLGTKLEIAQIKIPEFDNVKKEIIQKSPMAQTSSIGSRPEETQIFPNDLNDNEPEQKREDFSNPTEDFERRAEERKFKNGINIKDFNNYRANTKNFKKRNKLFEKFVGSYSGKIILFKKFQRNEEEYWDVKIDSRYKYNYNSKAYEGDATIEMSSPTRGPFSRSNSNGNNSSFQINSKYRNLLAIEASPSTFFIMKYSKKKNAWEGDVVKLNSKTTKYEQIGVIPVLYRN